MTKEIIKCSKCDEDAVYEDADNPNEVTNQTGFVLIEAGVWLCPSCVDDYFKAEGC